MLHAFDAGVHFVFLDELAALRRRDTSFDGSKEAGFVVQIADQNAFHEALGIDPGFDGHLR